MSGSSVDKKSFLSLRNVLIMPYVTLVILLAGVLAFLSYSTGRDAVMKLADHLLKETSSRISQAVDRHVIGSLATLKAVFPEGMVAPEDIRDDFENLKTRLWIATTLHTDPNNYVYYGSVDGQAFGLYRIDDDQVELRIKYDADAQRSYYELIGINGEPLYKRREMKLFDPRVRPWFGAAQNSSRDIWTSVYIDFGTADLVATRARRVLNANGKLQGVVATDMPLRALNEFVSSLDLSPNGIAFIIEPNGDLIASSCSSNVRRNDNGETVRLNAAESGHDILSEVYQQVKKRLERTTESPEPFYFKNSDGDIIHVASSRFSDQAGLTWFNVVAIPDEDIMGGISANVKRTVGLVVAATLLIALTGLAILNWVTRDIRKLSRAVNQIANGTSAIHLGIDRNDEIGELAQSFEAMQARLSTDHLTRLPNRYAFEQALAATAENDRYALLFIDINNFKSINDCYGHDAGDYALMTLATRLRQSVRRQDLVARFAGDEFVVLVRGVSSEDEVEPIRNKIIAALSEPLQIEGDTIELHGGAIGVAFSHEGDINIGALLIKADERMYIDKARLRKD